MTIALFPGPRIGAFPILLRHRPGGDTGALLASLVGYWPLRAASGIRYDLENGFHLTDTNTVTSDTGLVYPLAASFDAANSETLNFVHAGGNALDITTQNFWVAWWMKAVGSTLTTSTNGGRVLQKKGTGSNPGTPGYLFKVYRSGSNVITVAQLDDGVASVASNAVIAGTTDAWIFIAYTVNRTTGTVKVYANGELKLTDLDFAAVTGSLTTTRDFVLAGSDVSATQYYTGLLGPVMMGVGYIPTLAEINTLYNGGAGQTYVQMGGTEDVTPPAYSASYMGGTESGYTLLDTELLVQFDEDVYGTIADGWTVRYDGGSAETISGVSRTTDGAETPGNDTVILTLASAPDAQAIITLEYDDGVGDLADEALNVVAGFSNVNTYNGILPATPANLMATGGTDEADLSWDAVAVASFYDVRYSTDESNWTEVSEIVGTATTVTGLTA